MLIMVVKQNVEEKAATLAKQNRLISDERETLLSSQQRLSTINQNLEAEKRELHIMLDKRTRENDRLNGTLFRLVVKNYFS